MLEKELESKLRDRVKMLGGIAYKFTSPGQQGVPDRIVVLPGGKVGFIELKQLGKRETKYQRRQLNRLAELGSKVFLIDDINSMAYALEDIAEDKWPAIRWKVKPL